MAAVEGMLLAGRAPRYVQIPTAAAPEGEQSLRRWLDLGAAQAERLGVEQVPVVARDREEADSPELAALVDDAGLVYLSGGNPAFLAKTLRGTRVWDAVVAAWQSGAALAGCSAGAIALTGWVPSMRALDREPDPGLQIVPGLRVLPHFDKMLGWVPDLLTRAVHAAAGWHHRHRDRRGDRDRRHDRRRADLAGARQAAGVGAQPTGRVGVFRLVRR